MGIKAHLQEKNFRKAEKIFQQPKKNFEKAELKIDQPKVFL